MQLSKRTCSEDGCEKPYRARGYCVYHYTLARRTGAIDVKFPDIWDRLGPKIEVTGFCWLWTARCNKAGYGTTKVERKHWLAHRMIYTLLVGPIPDELHLDHLCRVHNCVNPDHLEPVTCKENVIRGFAARMTPFCPMGHRYTPENTYMERRAGKTDIRRCRKCRRVHQKRTDNKRKLGLAA